MTEIKPMLLSETWDKAILDDKKKLFQIKENGVRALVHVKNYKVVGIRNRSNNPILYCFPDFKEVRFPFNTAILDAEICVMKEGKSVFYNGIDKRRSSPSDSVLKNYPATMVVFDTLKIEDEVLLMKPYHYRYEKLFERNIEADNVKISINWRGDELWSKVKEQNWEGVVIKDQNAIYELGKRSKQYLKLKNYKLVEVLVHDVEPNDKGTKIFAHAEIDGQDIDVEAQLGGIFGVEKDTHHTLKYLDICGSRLIQPTKVSQEQVKAYGTT